MRGDESPLFSILYRKEEILIYNQNRDIIKNIISEALVNKSKDSTNNMIQRLIKIINNYLTRLDHFYLQLQKAASLIPQYQSIGADETTIKYGFFKQLTYNEKEIQDLLKEGYILIDTLRESFTGEQIKYTVGTVLRKKLYQKDMSLEQILNKAQLSFNSKSKLNNIFKLRLDFKNKSTFASQAGQAKAVVDKNKEEATTVFSAVWRYFHSEQNNHGKKYNKGNAYETYKLAVANRNFPNPNQIGPPISIEDIDYYFQLVKKNTASLAKGGDILNTQYKFISQMPSLITTNTAKTTLSQLVLIFQHYLNNNKGATFLTELQNVFIKDINFDELGLTIQKESIEISQKEMINIFKQLKIIL